MKAEWNIPCCFRWRVGNN